MFAPESGMGVRNRPRIVIGALRDLRSVLDAALPSTSNKDEGDAHGKAAGSAVRRNRIAKDPDRRGQEAVGLVFRKFA